MPDIRLPKLLANLGSKFDAAVTVPTLLDTAMSYLKGALNLLAALPAAVWASAARTLTAFAAQDLFVYPSNDDLYANGSPALNTSGVANTYSAWVQLIPNVGVGRVITYATIFIPTLGVAGNLVQIDIGEGAPGAEVTKQILTFPSTPISAYLVLPVHRAMTDNAAISVRVKTGLAAAQAFRVQLLVVG